MTRLRRYVGRIREELRRSIAEDHTPRETAGSFAFGTFVTMLPTLGAGLLLFAAVAYLSDRANPIALFASVAVFNPVTKWGVYVASYGLGVLLLGPVEEAGLTDASLDAGPDVLARLLAGNLALAVVATVVGYAVVYRLAVAYRQSELAEFVDEVAEAAVDDVAE